MSFAIGAPTWVWEVGTISFGGDYPLQLTISDDVIYQSPASLHVTVANGTPNAQVTFSVSGSSAENMVINLDESGAANLVNVPVDVPTPGTYVLLAFTGSPASIGDGEIGGGFIGLPDSTDTAESAELATANFVVQQVDNSGGLVLPNYGPPPNVQPSSGVKKWVFQDPATAETYHFEINPNQMTSPFAQRQITYQATTAIDGNKLAWEGQEAAVQWQFEGYIRSQTEYDAFVFWRNKRNRIWVTDHYGRAWLGYITNFDAKPRRSMNVPWSHTYTMTFLIFGGPVTPV